MTSMLPRTHFHSSRLVRCLAELELLDGVDAGDAFAEKLGQWIHFADAITLAAVHGDGMPSVPGERPRTRASVPDGVGNVDPLVTPDALDALDADVGRVQSALANAIMHSFRPSLPGALHRGLPAPEFDLPLKPATAYAPYRRFAEAHQRDMEMRIQPLRARVRQAVANASPALRKLADLDATLEKILRDRESRLLGRIPVLLGRRFEQLYKQHQQQCIDAGQADDPAAWSRPGGWLARFCADLQMLLLAELELRLQPTMGLLEAGRQDRQNTQAPHNAQAGSTMPGNEHEAHAPQDRQDRQ